MSGKPHVTRMVLTFAKPKSSKSVKSVDKTKAEATVQFRPTNNTRKLLNHLAKESDAPLCMENIPIGPERADLAFLALVLQTCANSHKRTCSELGNVKAALLNATHDDPAVMELIERIIRMPLGQDLYAAASQLYNAAMKG